MGAESQGSDEILQSLQEGEALSPLRPPAAPIPLHGKPFSQGLRVALDRLDAGDDTVREHFAHVHPHFVAMYDGYPKSSVHLLILPRARIDGPRSLTTEDLPMLRYLAAYCTWLQGELAVQFPALTWRHGAHANPTCKHLHVHLLSQDFASPWLNNKQRWNSFQPPFLVPVQAMIQNLQRGCREGALGTLDEDSAYRALGSEMTCTACGLKFGNNRIRLAALKEHLASCNAVASQPPPALAIAADAEQLEVRSGLDVEKLPDDTSNVGSLQAEDDGVDCGGNETAMLMEGIEDDGGKRTRRRGALKRNKELLST
mmetsp:Transcript_72785/g.136005  ORF Transcript_72785/g.136005 Transcript_72785/m.136005 type:complete len:314 (-) Transcript_72785:54-995(-)